VNRHPLLKTGMWIGEETKDELKMLRLLAENVLTKKVMKSLNSMRLSTMVSKDIQKYLKSVTYIEYGGFNVYDTFFIGDGKERQQRQPGYLMNDRQQAIRD
jgi:hypothetical protein